MPRTTGPEQPGPPDPEDPAVRAVYASLDPDTPDEHSPLRRALNAAQHVGHLAPPTRVDRPPRPPGDSG